MDWVQTGRGIVTNIGGYYFSLTKQETDRSVYLKEEQPSVPKDKHNIDPFSRVHSLSPLRFPQNFQDSK